MKSMLIVGILMVVIGVVSLAYQGFTYSTQKEVVEIGPIAATKETRKTIPLPPLLGGVALASGVVLILVGSRKLQKS